MSESAIDILTIIIWRVAVVLLTAIGVAHLCGGDIDSTLYWFIAIFGASALYADMFFGDD